MSYIPSKDSNLKAFAANFAAVLAVSFAAYGLSGADSALITAASDDYAAAYDLAVNPDTRTKPIVADKDGKKALLTTTIRIYGQRIQHNAGVTNEMKESLGLPVRDPSPTPVPAPATQPMLSIPGATPLQHTIRFNDSSTPSKRAKPPGAIGMLLFVKLGETAATTPDGSEFVHMVTQQPFIVNFAPGDVKKVATYWAKWVTRKGLEGGWSLPVSMTVA